MHASFGVRHHICYSFGADMEYSYIPFYNWHLHEVVGGYKHRLGYRGTILIVVFNSERLEVPFNVVQ